MVQIKCSVCKNFNVEKNTNKDFAFLIKTIFSKYSHEEMTDLKNQSLDIYTSNFLHVAMRNGFICISDELQH